MTKTFSSSAQRVQDALRSAGFDLEVIEFEQPTRSSAEAARAIGCSLGQIAKSVIFTSKEKHMPVLVIASGSNRVNTTHLEEALGEAVEIADPAFVLEKTGYAVGGVPPLGHASPLVTFIDQDLLRYNEIWAAAGGPSAVFKLTPCQLMEMTGGRVISI
jgi:prolyl-tRNA editing enzyme YbaK/EbsC (Cys-tRNA(Pro) deacylase)